MKEIDIASFAESMLTERIDSGKPVQFAAQTAPNAPDVSEVEVPEDFTSQILTEGHWDKAEIKVALKSRNPQQRSTQEDQKPSLFRQKLQERDEPTFVINEASVYKKHLLSEYKKKVSDLEDLLSVMEDMGMVSSADAGAVNSTGRNGMGPMGGTKTTRKKKRKNVRDSRFNR